MSEHEVLTPPDDRIGPAVCCCGWESAAESGNDRIDQGDAHMYDHYRVFVQSREDDGCLVSCWGA